MTLKTLEAIQASAGTGKTFTLAQRVVEEVGKDDEPIAIGRIVVVTFTIAATAELKSRVRERLRDASAGLRARSRGEPWKAPDKVLEAWVAKAPPEAEARLHQAVVDFDQAGISTIHSFCSRLLATCALEAGVSLGEDAGSQGTDIARQVVDDAYRRLTTTQSPVFVQALEGMGLDRPALKTLADRAAELEAALIPTNAVEPGTPPDISAYQEAVAEALAVNGEGFLNFLIRHPDLCHRKGSGASVSFGKTNSTAPFWRVRRWLQNASLLTKVPEAAHRFTHATVSEATLAGRTPPSHAFLDAMEVILPLRATLGPQVQAWATRQRRWLVGQVQQAICDESRRRDERSFDDLLRLVRDASDRPKVQSAVAERWDLALLDEFQDTDPVQWEVFRKLFGPRRLVVVGDPKQSIYAFRRADIHAYQRAVKQASSVETLDDNYRSDERLLDAIKALFAGSEPFAMPGLAFKGPDAIHKDNRLGDDRAPLFIRHIELDGSPTKDDFLDSWELLEPCVERVAEDVARELIDHGATPDQCAVLTRTNPEALLVRDALRRRGVPSVLRTSETAFASPVAKELLRVFEALVEPADRGRVGRALVTSLMGLSAQKLVDLRSDPARWAKRMLEFRTWGADLREKGVLVALERWATQSGVWPRLLARPLGGRQTADLRHLIELLHRAEAEERMSPSGLCAWLSAGGAGVDEEEAGQRVETDAKAVQVSTIHKAKGLEYDRVWLPFAYKTTFLTTKDKAVPRYYDEATGRWTLDLRVPLPEDKAAAMWRDKLREDLRLLYVAVTRARHRCVLYWGAAGSEDAALGYLLHRGSEPGTVAELRARAKARKRSDTRIREDLVALEAAGIDHVCWGADSDTPCSLWVDPAALSEDDLHLRTRTRGPLFSRWRRASYSGLVRDAREKHHARLRAERELGVAPAAVAPAPGLPPGPVPTADIFGGPKLGDLVHDAMELHDFCGSRDDLLVHLEALAPRHGVSAEVLPTLADALDGALSTPLFEDGFALAGHPRSRTLRESEFVLPVLGGYGATRGDAVSPEALAACFGEPLATRVAALGFQAMKGFLGGKLDLIFEQDGRFHLLDWKSNKLGTRWTDYSPAALQREMSEGASVYELQANLYALSLHLMLRQRLGAEVYDYDLHFGDVLYAFVRGMSPATGLACGVWRHRPTLATLDRLEATLYGADHV